MEKIKIRYKKRIQRWFFYFGLAWIIIGIAMFYFSGQVWSSYFYLGLGLFILIIYLYYAKKQYLTIENGILTKNNMLLSKSIPLDEIKEIKYFGGDYTLVTDRGNFTIETYPIDKNSLEKLKAILGGLNAEMKIITPN